MKNASTTFCVFLCFDNLSILLLHSYGMCLLLGLRNETVTNIKTNECVAGQL